RQAGRAAPGAGRGRAEAEGAPPRAFPSHRRRRDARLRARRHPPRPFDHGSRRDRAEGFHHAAAAGVAPRARAAWLPAAEPHPVRRVTMAEPLLAQPPQAAVDPVLMQVVKNALDSVAEQMAVTLQYTAHSTVIREVL